MHGLYKILLMSENGRNQPKYHDDDYRDYDYRRRPERHERYERDEHDEREMHDREKKHHKKFDRETAEKWMSKMENEDGTKGAHWSYEQVTQLMSQKNIDCDPAEFYAAVNMMYSDYCKVAKQHNVNTVDFYFAMAKAFLDDSDGGENKIGKYYEYIVDD